ncbi:hypothetical protein ACP275_14G154100 [Erythranthe tilingii]
MAKPNKIIYLLLISLLIFTLAQAEHRTVRRRSRARAFIEIQCQQTLYPDLCIRSLSYYVSNFTSNLSLRRLAQVALRVTLANAESTKTYVADVAKELNETKSYRFAKECLDQISDGVAQLSNCIKETQMIKEDGETAIDFPWHASNVKTWMSTALTDASTCVDGFSGRAFGGKKRAMIKAKVLNLQQATSISLALFNRFAARYRSSHVDKPKV